MPYQWVDTYRTFTPPEAHALADSFQAEASAVALWTHQLAQVVGVLDMTWEGRAQRRFMADLRTAVRDAEQLAHQLEALAGAGRGIQVSEAVRLWQWAPNYQ